MNWDIVKDHWKQLHGHIKQQWGELTDDDLDRIDGRRDKLLGRLQQKYGITKSEADSLIREWENDYQDDTTKVSYRKDSLSARI